MGKWRSLNMHAQICDLLNTFKENFKSGTLIFNIQLLISHNDYFLFLSFCIQLSKTLGLSFPNVTWFPPLFLSPEQLLISVMDSAKTQSNTVSMSESDSELERCPLHLLLNHDIKHDSSIFEWMLKLHQQPLTFDLITKSKYDGFLNFTLKGHM